MVSIEMLGEWHVLVSSPNETASVCSRVEIDWPGEKICRFRPLECSKSGNGKPTSDGFKANNLELEIYFEYQRRHGWLADREPSICYYERQEIKTEQESMKLPVLLLITDAQWHCHRQN